MSAGKSSPLVIHGWAIFAHPMFLAQIEVLVRQVEALKQKNPTRPEYRQGTTLGDDHKHWFRAKFFQQNRLFFRYHATGHVIVFAWVNDVGTRHP